MRRQAKRGYTLVEMVAVMSTMAVLLTTIATTIHTMVRATNRLRDASMVMHSMDRLATRLQADAHRADTANVTDGALTLQTPGATTTYRQVGNQVECHRTSDAVDSSRETFALPQGFAVTWAVDESPPLVRVTIQPTAGLSADEAALVPTQILAALAVERTR